MRSKRAVAGAAGQTTKGIVGIAEGVDHFPRIVHDENLFAWGEELVKSLEPVGDDRCATGGSLEETSGRAISGTGHAVAGEVEREFRTRIQCRMIARRYMLK